MKKSLIFLLLTIGLLSGAAYLMHIGILPSPSGDFPADSIRSSIRSVTGHEESTPLEVSEADLDTDSANVCRYYYDTLSDEEKQLYIQLYVSVRDRLDSAPVSANDTDNISHVMEFMLLDNPQLYYVDNWSIETQTSYHSTQTLIHPSFNMNTSERKKAESVITSFTRTCLAGIRSDMTDYEKAVYLFQYVVEHTDYELDAPYNQNIYSVALGKSVCKGYTCAYKYLCDQVGIPCISISGTMEQSHAWNLVQIDGEWCHVDCTAGDDITTPAAMTDFSWFGLDDETIMKTHTIDNADLFPACTTTANSYYVRNHLYFETFELDVLKTQFAGGRNFSFQCASTETYNQACTVLTNSSDLSRYLSSLGLTRISYIPNSSTNTLFILLE